MSMWGKHSRKRRTLPFLRVMYFWRAVVIST